MNMENTIAITGAFEFENGMTFRDLFEYVKKHNLMDAQVMVRNEEGELDVANELCSLGVQAIIIESEMYEDAE